MPRHIAIIDPAITRPELDCFNQLSLASALPLNYYLPAMFGMESFTDRDLAGVVILGSASSPTDNSPWQKDLAARLTPLLARGLPTLGLCFGHQFLAHVAGARVELATPDHFKYLGWRDVALDATPLTGGAAVQGPLVVSHREIVTECPRGWRVVGRSDKITIEALAHETFPQWGFQPHPEATPQFLKNCGIEAAAPAEKFALGQSLVRRFLEIAAQS